MIGMFSFFFLEQVIYSHTRIVKKVILIKKPVVKFRIRLMLQYIKVIIKLYYKKL